MLIVFLITFLLCILIAKYFKLKSLYHEVDKFPGPKPLPIIGNTLQFGRNGTESFQAMLKFVETYGKTLRFYLHPIYPTVLTTDPEHVEKLLSTTANLTKSATYDLLLPWLGKGLIVSPVETWHSCRKVLTPTFHFKILDQFVKTFEKCGDQLTKKLSEFDGKALDVYPILKMYALDNICETSMGVEINALSNGDVPYINSVNELLELLLARMFSINRFDFIAKLNGIYKYEVNLLERLKNFSKEAIEKRKLLLTSSNVKNNESSKSEFETKKKVSFIDLLLQLGDNQKLTDEDIREEADNFLFAGHDTITTSVSTVVYILAKHPEIQEKILQEIEAVIGDEPITYSNLQNMKYLECVIKESMRLHAPVPFIERKLTQEITFDCIKLPPGTTVNIFIYGLQRNPKYFPDPDKFIPERFETDNCVNMHPYAFIPFSAGPRNCIGQKYAMLAMKTALVKIIKNFVIKPKPNFEWILSNSAVLKSANGIYVILEKRE